jgi:hypothetical protein
MSMEIVPASGGPYTSGGSSRHNNEIQVTLDRKRHVSKKRTRDDNSEIIHINATAKKGRAGERLKSKDEAYHNAVDFIFRASGIMTMVSKDNESNPGKDIWEKVGMERTREVDEAVKKLFSNLSRFTNFMETMRKKDEIMSSEYAEMCHKAVSDILEAALKVKKPSAKSIDAVTDILDDLMRALRQVRSRFWRTKNGNNSDNDNSSNDEESGDEESGDEQDLGYLDIQSLLHNPIETEPKKESRKGKIAAGLRSFFTSRRAIGLTISVSYAALVALSYWDSSFQQMASDWWPLGVTGMSMATGIDTTTIGGLFYVAGKAAASTARAVYGSNQPVCDTPTVMEFNESLLNMIVNKSEGEVDGLIKKYGNSLVVGCTSSRGATSSLKDIPRAMLLKLLKNANKLQHNFDASPAGRSVPNLTEVLSGFFAWSGGIYINHWLAEYLKHLNTNISGIAQMNWMVSAVIIVVQLLPLATSAMLKTSSALFHRLGKKQSRSEGPSARMREEIKLALRKLRSRKKDLDSESLFTRIMFEVKKLKSDKQPRWVTSRLRGDTFLYYDLQDADRIRRTLENKDGKKNKTGKKFRVKLKNLQSSFPDIRHQADLGKGKVVSSEEAENSSQYVYLPLLRGPPSSKRKRSNLDTNNTGTNVDNERTVSNNRDTIPKRKRTRKHEKK